MRLKTLLCVAGVAGFLATATCPAYAALNEGRFTATGTFHAVELRSDSSFPLGFEAYVWVLVKEGSEAFDIAVKCPSVEACWPVAASWFNCSLISTVVSTDPNDAAVTITRKSCTSFTINQCVKAAGTIQNHPEPVSHYGSHLIAETIGNVKPFNCDDIEE